MFSSVAGLGTNSSSKSSSYNSSSSIGGLISGIDTDALIKKLTVLAQTKIDSAYQQKQKIQWKQTTYRDIISSLSSLKSEYFDVVNSSTNLSSSSAFNTWLTASSSSAVTVSSTSANTGAKLEITSIDQLAVAQAIESGTGVSGGINGTGSIDGLKGKQMQITLDGVTKTIDFGTDPQAALNNAFGMSNIPIPATNPVQYEPRVKLTEDAAGGTFKITTTGTSKLAIGGDSTVLASLGLKAGQSTHIEITKALKDTSFANALVGNDYSFTVNGVDFNFTGSDSVMKVINTINSSKAGVKVTYSEIEDKFTMTSTTSGSGQNITINQTKGNMLTSMFGVSTSGVTELNGSIVCAPKIPANGVFTLPGTGWDGLIGKSFDITVKGITKTITLPAFAEGQDEETKPQAMVDSFNSQLKTAFGNSDVQFKLNGNTVELTAANNKPVTLGTVDPEGTATELLTALNFSNGVSNVLTAQSKLSDLSIVAGELTLGSSTTIAYTGDTTLQELIDDINAQTGTTGITASVAEGKFTLKSDGSSPLDLSDNGGAMKALLGVSKFGSGSSSMVTKEIQGQNAVITLADGTQIERNSNTFTVNGINLQLNSTTTSASPITINSTQNMDAVVANIKGFIERYNTIVGAVKGKLTEEYYSSYPPLTDAQRAEMSESEIKLWEDKSKSGIVKNDQILNQMLTDFDDVLMSGSINSPYTLDDIGIESSTSITEGTKLVFNEEKFRAMLTKDHEGVSRLFTDPTEGIADKFTAAIDKYSSTSVVNVGLLVEVSGTSTYTDSDQASQLTSLDEKIVELKDKLTAQETRLWKQFSAMESALSQLNSQSSWLTSLTSN